MRPAALRPCFSSACPYASSVACRARIKPSTSLQEATPAALRRTMESKSDERLADSESIILSCVVRPLPDEPRTKLLEKTSNGKKTPGGAGTHTGHTRSLVNVNEPVLSRVSCPWLRCSVLYGTVNWVPAPCRIRG